MYSIFPSLCPSWTCTHLNSSADSRNKPGAWGCAWARCCSLATWYAPGQPGSRQNYACPGSGARLGSAGCRLQPNLCAGECIAGRMAANFFILMPTGSTRSARPKNWIWIPCLPRGHWWSNGRSGLNQSCLPNGCGPGRNTRSEEHRTMRFAAVESGTKPCLTISVILFMEGTDATGN